MKVSFLDFWGGFVEDNNFIFSLLKDIKGDVEISKPEDSDLIIFSCFGKEHLKYSNKKRIFCTGENLRPNFDECDYSFSFDFDDYGGKNIRIPLWVYQIDWFGIGGYDNPEFVLPLDQINDNEFIRKDKTKFCSTVFNNKSPFRYGIIHILSNYKKVDGYGHPFGNWFYGENTKYKTISDYKFNICFENSIYPGYYTEKLFHAKTSGCIPIYWADERVSEDFNTKSFINLWDFKNNLNELVEYIKEVDNNEGLYNSIRNEKLFNKEPSLDNIKKRIDEIL